jgi:AcrR family transcriptional regulator
MEQEQRSIETREAIEKVSVKLFAKQGIHATSLEEVARRAGISKGAIYWHYDSKEDLLLAVLARVRSAWRAIVLADLEEAANPKDQLRIVFRNYLSLMTEHVDITLFLQRMRLETSPSIVPVVAKFLSEKCGSHSRNHREWCKIARLHTPQRYKCPVLPHHQCPCRCPCAMAH